MSATAYEPDAPWVRQPFDTDLGFALFSIFLMMAPPRRIRDLAKTSGIPWTQLETLAVEGHWQPRAALWDEHLAGIARTTIERVTEETAEAVARRQLTLTRRMQTLADREFAALEKLQAQAPDMTGTLSPRDAMRLAVNGIRLERLIMGEVTDRTETAAPDVSALSVEELREARRLQAKAGVR